MVNQHKNYAYFWRLLLFLKIEETQNKPKIIDFNVTLSEVSFTVLRHDIFLILSLFKKMSHLLSNT